MSTTNAKALMPCRYLHDASSRRIISESEFEFMYRLYSPRLFSRLQRLVKSQSQAAEILQNVFLTVWENRRSIDRNKSFHSLLYKIAENSVFDFFQKVGGDKNKESQLVVLSATNGNDTAIGSFEPGK